MEESAGAQLLPLPATLEPISRPSSTSTTASTTMPQLPGISAIAAAATASATSSPQLRPTNTLPTIYPAASPAGTAAGSGGNLPTCQNCSTSTTPLWRRDEMGSVLCNACGLFLKLHGRPRPISLKTDVIKSRNRVKTMRPELGMKKKNPGVATDANGAELQAQQAAAAALGARRASQKSANGHVDGSHSPVSRTATPNMYGSHLPLYHGVEDPQLHAQGLQGFVSATADGRAASPMNGERLDIPQTHEQLVATNSSLKTRVSELEVINDFIRGRLEQYESYGAGPREGQEAGPTEAQLRAQLDTLTKSETQLRTQLDESHRRENNLKRRLDEMEVELKEAKEALEIHENGRAKKLRVSDMVEESETSTPQSTS